MSSRRNKACQVGHFLGANWRSLVFPSGLPCNQEPEPTLFRSIACGSGGKWKQGIGCYFPTSAMSTDNLVDKRALSMHLDGICIFGGILRFAECMRNWKTRSICSLNWGEGSTAHEFSYIKEKGVNNGTAWLFPDEKAFLPWVAFPSEEKEFWAGWLWVQSWLPQVLQQQYLLVGPYALYWLPSPTGFSK